SVVRPPTRSRIRTSPLRPSRRIGYEESSRGMSTPDSAHSLAGLSLRRLTALVVLAAALAVYFAAHEHLRNLSLWWDVAVISLLVMPAVFLLVLLLLPLRRAHGIWFAALACTALAIAFSFADWEGPASFARLGAATFFGWIFLTSSRRCRG